LKISSCRYEEIVDELDHCKFQLVPVGINLAAKLIKAQAQ
jgi:hypothetical protein